MNIKIENLGKIKKAEVTLGDITTIIGKNDNGKSTLGKGVYTIIKSKSNSLINVYQDSQRKLIYNQLSQLEALLEKFEGDIGVDSFSKFGVDTYFRISRSINAINENSEGDFISNESYLEEIKNDFNNFNNSDENLKKEVLACISTLEKFLKNRFESNLVKTRMAKVVLNSTFEKPIKDGEENLKIIAGSNSLVYKNNSQLEYNYNESEFNYEDVIMIESPIALKALHKRFTKNLSPDAESQLINTILSAQIEEEGLFDDIIYRKIKIIEEKIESTINGKFVYVPKDRAVKFLSGSETYDFNDVATGIKSLGTYMLILKKLNGKVILILDEPEVHLHPEWQVILAEILTIINQELHTKIIINTHSAFFLEAIENFGEKYNLNNNFYYCDEGKFEDVTKNLEKAYTKVNGNAYKMLDDIIKETKSEGEKINEYS